ncbi:hypothetical protein C7S16_0298 [Burkholderia thailandensis]|uniref:Lipoprotein n=1 Tax=Burkholderia thailandensis TaxID=57975 RepID=A0AAW9D017_BURTH|nr:hypothetical protein [Burkholderia thailandensis]MDW9254698.1 hypothetical protein [Burkholderia thailandensis]
MAWFSSCLVLAGGCRADAWRRGFDARTRRGGDLGSTSGGGMGDALRAGRQAPNARRADAGIKRKCPA